MYECSFPQPLELTDKCKISLQSFAMYNSTNNISAILGNNWFSVKWIDGTTKTYSVSDGYYSVSDLNTVLQAALFGWGWYATSNSGNTIVYFAQFQVNSVMYKNELDIFLVPSATEATAKGYVPSGKGGFTSFATTESQIQLTLAPSLASKYFGFKTQSVFPLVLTGAPENISFVSDTCPVISNTFCIVASMNILPNGNIGLPIGFQIPMNVGFGQLIQYNTTFESELTCRAGRYNAIQVQLWDQSAAIPLQFSDNEISMVLILETP